MLRQLHVYLLEPHDDTRRMLSMYLAQSGLRVTAVGDPRALAITAECDLLIIELSVPDVRDGMALIERLRATPDTHGLGIIAVTTSPREEIGAPAARAGADAVLMKPFYPPELLKEVRRVMQLRFARLAQSPLPLPSAAKEEELRK